MSSTPDKRDSEPVSGYNDNDLTIEEDSWAGIGWKLHFGRVINPTATGGGETEIEMGDGSRHPLYTTTARPEGWQTKSFWVYDRSAHTLKMPNGIVYTFGHTAYINAQIGTVRYVTEIRDPFNNTIEFSYFGAPGPVDGVSQIRQHLGGGQVREVNFTYDTTGLNAISSMSYDGRQWLYYHSPAGPPGFSHLDSVKPPVIAATEYDYSNGAPAHELTMLRTPGDGTVTYSYGDVTQVASSVSNKVRSVSTRTLGGPNVTAGTWTFSYRTGPNQDTTRVACPCGTRTYKFNGIGSTGDFAGWLAGTLAEETIEEASVVLERVQLFWVQSEPVSTDPTIGMGGIWTDPGVFKPLLAQRTTTRGPQSWSTIFTYHVGLGNFNDYGRAWRVNEDGDVNRFTDSTFLYGFTPYIVDRVSKTVVRVGAQAYETNASYDLGTGFQTATAIGVWGPGAILTEFEPDSSGNVAAAEDGLGNRTTFLYAWGRVRRVQSPHLTTVSTINPDGTVFEEETGGLTTRYVYDQAFRVREIRPPANTTYTTFEYEDQHPGHILVARAPSFTEYYTDGFGRVIRTRNAVNLKSRVERDACGRSTFQSYAYTAGTGASGVTTTYDALGRSKTVAEGTVVTSYAYTGIDVTVTDPLSRSTTYDYSGFGGPNAARLMSVRDPHNVVTSYTYDVVEKLTGVSGPGTVPTRTWVYDGRGLLLSETQPEAGTTTYVHDVAGNLTQFTNALGQVTTLTYDGNNRLRFRNAPGTADDVETTYGAWGEVRKTATPAVAGATTSTTFDYDAVGRLSTRIDLLAGQTFESRYGYDLSDRLAALTYPSGRVVAYEPDAEARTLVVRNNGTLFAHGFTYTDAGQLGGYVTGSVAHAVTYDTRQRVDRITAGPAGGLDLTYSYDQANQVRAIADPRPGMAQSFTYDTLGRLQIAQGPWGLASWQYDPAGNRTQEQYDGTTNYTIHQPTQRLTATTGAKPETFGYDALGRVTSDSRASYTYNQRSLLATATGPTVAASYGYDAGGLRAIRTVNGDTTYSVRGAGGEVLSEYRASCGTAVWARDVVSAGGRLLGAVRSTATGPTAALTAATGSVNEASPSIAIGVRLTTSSGAVTPCPSRSCITPSAGRRDRGATTRPISVCWCFRRAPPPAPCRTYR